MNPRTPVIATLLLALLAARAPAQQPQPLRYTLKIADPATRTAHITATYPAAGLATLDLMMPLWTPGYYRAEDYPAKLSDLAATSATGATLAVEKVKKPLAYHHRRHPHRHSHLRTCL
jgi:hypothetical protein